MEKSEQRLPEASACALMTTLQIFVERHIL